MDVSTGGFQTPNGHLNVTLTDARGVLKQIQDAGYQGAFIVANPIGIGVNNGQMVPEVQTGIFGSAPWVDPANDLSGTPDNVPVYLQIWIESNEQGAAATNYYEVRALLDGLANGKTLPELIGV